MTQYVPEGYNSVMPYLVFDDARAAIDFYKHAFGAELEDLMEPEDQSTVIHAAIRIGNSLVMMSDINPEWGGKAPDPNETERPISFFVYVENADESYKRAIAAGAREKMPPTDMFWGDRMSVVIDPFGHEWSLGQHIKDISEEERHNIVNNMMV